MLTFRNMSVIAKIIFGVPDKMSGRPSALSRTFWVPVRHFPTWLLVNISGHSYFPWQHFMCIEPCWTKCPAMSELSAGHQQKSAGHVRHVRHISRSLTCWEKRWGWLNKTQNLELSSKHIFMGNILVIYISSYAYPQIFSRYLQNWVLEEMTRIWGARPAIAYKLKSKENI